MRSGGMLEELFDFGAGKIRYREDPRRAAQYPLRHLQMPGSPEAGLLARARHMIQQIVHGHDIRTRQKSRHRKKIRDVDQIAVESLQRARGTRDIHGSSGRELAVQPYENLAGADRSPEPCRRADQKIRVFRDRRGPGCERYCGCKCRRQTRSSAGCRWRSSPSAFNHRATQRNPEELRSHLCLRFRAAFGIERKRLAKIQHLLAVPSTAQPRRSRFSSASAIHLPDLAHLGFFHAASGQVPACRCECRSASSEDWYRTEWHSC